MTREALRPAATGWGGRLGTRAVPRPVAFGMAYLLAVIPAVVLALIQPVWQLTDEAQHFDVVAHYAHWQYPLEGVTTLRPETVGLMVATGNYRWSPPETLPRPAVIDPRQFAAPPDHLSGYPFQLWVRRHIWWFSYEAMQPPLFYAAATPVWIAAERLGGPFAAVFALRVMNALFVALLAPLALAGAWLLAPGRRAAGPLAVALIAAMPGLLLNGSQVTNDTFGAVLGSATVLAAAWAARSGWTARRSALLGLLFGLTLLSKLTAAGLLAGIAVAWAWPVLRQRTTWLRQARLGAISAAVAGAVLAPWLAVNVLRYGHPVPTAEAARLLGAGTGGSRWIWQSLDYCYATFWTGEHRNTLPYTGLFEVAMLLIGIPAAVGVLRLLRSTAWFAADRPVLAVLVVAVTGQWLWAMALPYTSGLGGMTPGRYLYPAVVPAILLLVAGGMAVTRALQAQVAGATVFLLLSLLNFVAYASGQTAINHADRTGPPARASVIGVEGRGSFQYVTIAADRLVPDYRTRSVWVHIHVHNDSLQAADWWPAARATLSTGTRAYGDYASSTPFPETLVGGADYWGWIRLALTPARLEPGATLTLTFPDVAANQYRDVGRLYVRLTLPSAGPGSSGSVQP